MWEIKPLLLLLLYATIAHGYMLRSQMMKTPLTFKLTPATGNLATKVANGIQPIEM